jgi:hypothetical protein
MEDTSSSLSHDPDFTTTNEDEEDQSLVWMQPSWHASQPPQHHHQRRRSSLQSIPEESEWNAEEEQDEASDEPFELTGPIPWMCIVRDDVVLLDIGESNVPDQVPQLAQTILFQGRNLYDDEEEEDEELDELGAVWGWEVLQLNDESSSLVESNQNDTTTSTRPTTKNAKFQGLRIHVYEVVQRQDDEEEDGASFLLAWMVGVVYDVNQISTPSVQQFLADALAFTQTSRERDPTWRSGGPHACQYLFGPVFQKRLEDIVSSFSCTTSVPSNQKKKKTHKMTTTTTTTTSSSDADAIDESICRDIIRRNREIFWDICNADESSVEDDEEKPTSTRSDDDEDNNNSSESEEENEEVSQLLTTANHSPWVTTMTTTSNTPDDVDETSVSSSSSPADIEESEYNDGLVEFVQTLPTMTDLYNKCGSNTAVPELVQSASSLSSLNGILPLEEMTTHHSLNDDNNHIVARIQDQSMESHGSNSSWIDIVYDKSGMEIVQSHAIEDNATKTDSHSSWQTDVEDAVDATTTTANTTMPNDYRHPDSPTSVVRTLDPHPEEYESISKIVEPPAYTYPLEENDDEDEKCVCFFLQKLFAGNKSALV